MDWVPLREIIMLGAALCSYRFGDRRARFEDNQFEWGPIAEVATLFIDPSRSRPAAAARPAPRPR